MNRCTLYLFLPCFDSMVRISICNRERYNTCLGSWNRNWVNIIYLYIFLKVTLFVHYLAIKCIKIMISVSYNIIFTKYLIYFIHWYCMYMTIYILERISPLWPVWERCWPAGKTQIWIAINQWDTVTHAPMVQWKRPVSWN